MKALDFNLPNEIKHSFEKGEVTFRNNRFLLFEANAIGLLRQNIIETLGMDEARKMFLKFGYVNGYSDFMEMKTSYEFDNEIELLSAGPIMHTWRGVNKAGIKQLHFNRAEGEFYIHGQWLNSFEAEQHLTYSEISSEPACWSLMGYSSGWCSAFFGSKVISIEFSCVGKGDDNCECEIKPPDDWDYEIAKPYIEALKEF